ncbi:MAG: AlpA family transcriptional regulator [Gallionella sp.]|nr:AlpA family transcriptional regulator [Gallionella sp.]
MAEQHVTLTILRRKQVEARTGLSRSTIYDKINPMSPRHDPTFPKQVKLGADAVGWLEGEVNAWLQSRVIASRSQSQQCNLHTKLESVA